MLIGWGLNILNNGTRLVVDTLLEVGDKLSISNNFTANCFHLFAP